MSISCEKKQVATSCPPEDQLESLADAVKAVQKTFALQFGFKLEPDGPPSSPDPEGVKFGGTLALTNESVKYLFATVFPEQAALDMTRKLFALPEDDEIRLDDLADALSEIPNVAAGAWKAMREKHDEHYQMGLPLFMEGNCWLKYFQKGVNAQSQRMQGPGGVSLQVILIWR